LKVAVRQRKDKEGLVSIEHRFAYWRKINLSREQRGV